MSNRPGIGYSAMHDVADTFLRYGDGELDVPAVLRRGNKLFPYGRYLKGKLREMVDVDKEEAARAAIARSQMELQLLREIAAQNSETVLQVYRANVSQPVRNWKARQKLRVRKK